MKRLLLIGFILISSLSFGQVMTPGAVASSGVAGVDSANWESGFKLVYYDWAEADRPGLDTADIYNAMYRDVNDTSGTDLDVFNFYALTKNGSDAALSNWIDIASPSTLTGSPTWTAKQGFTWSSGNYLRTFNPTSGSPKFTQNSAHFSVYCRTSGISGNDHILGSTADANIYFRPDNGAGNVVSRFNSSGAENWTTVGSQGYFFINRNSSANVTFYYDGATEGDNASTSAALSSGILTVGHSLAYPNTNQAAAATIGGSLSAQQIAEINRAVEVVMDYLGTGVQ